MGLRLRVILTLTIPAVLLVGIHGYFRVRQEQDQLLAEDRRYMDLTVRTIQIVVENALRGRQIADVRNLVNQIVDRQDGIEPIRLFDARAHSILASSGLTRAETAPSAALGRLIATGTTDSYYDDRRDPPLLYYVAPLRGRSGRVEGAMEIVHIEKGTGRDLSGHRARPRWRHPCRPPGRRRYPSQRLAPPDGGPVSTMKGRLDISRMRTFSWPSHAGFIER
jgi:hypothetical protein